MSETYPYTVAGARDRLLDEVNVQIKDHHDGRFVDGLNLAARILGQMRDDTPAPHIQEILYDAFLPHMHDPEQMGNIISGVLSTLLANDGDQTIQVMRVHR